MATAAVIVAAGLGERLDPFLPKQFINIIHKPLLYYTLEHFIAHDKIDAVVLVVNEKYIDKCKADFSHLPHIIVTAGGSHRQASVYNGLLACPETTDAVLIHDGARPFVTKENIDDCIENAIQYKACALGTYVKDTIKIAKDDYIQDTVDRSKLIAIQTPQAFLYSFILQAHKKAAADNFLATDDCMLAERMGQKVKIVIGSDMNIKITTPFDLAVAKYIIEKGVKP